MFEPERIEFYGKWAFFIGLVLAGVAGILFEAEEAVFWVLAILGVIVGLLNITREDTQGFLLAAIALTLSATALNLIPIVGETFANPGVCGSLCRWSDDRGRIESTVRDRPAIILLARRSARPASGGRR